MQAFLIKKVMVVNAENIINPVVRIVDADVTGIEKLFEIVCFAPWPFQYRVENEREHVLAAWTGFWVIYKDVSHDLHQTLICKTEIFVGTYNEMVEKTKVKQICSVFKPGRYTFV